ncbi:MAG: hypothetical protein KDH16_24620, partial [Rhodocyclaceae bacterium]|nr:hypothetical protein [Rhodocyclaceae bacterium]
STYTSSVINGTPKSPDLPYLVYQFSIGSMCQFTSGSDKRNRPHGPVQVLDVVVFLFDSVLGRQLGHR